MKISKMLILTFVLVLIGVPVLAQQAPRADNNPAAERAFTPGQGPDGPVSQEKREEIQEKIETIRVMRLTEELKLDADAGVKVAAVISRIEQKRRDIMGEQHETMKALRQALKAQKSDEAGIKRLLDKLENNQRSMQEVRNEEIKSLKNILTIEQQARFLIFQQEFQREIRKMIAGTRGGRNGKGPGPGPGPAGGDSGAMQ